MLKDFKLLAKNTLLYSFGNIATKIVGLILLPIYTNKDYLSISEYGILTDIEILTQLLVAILGVSLYQSLTRWYWDKELIKKRGKLVFTILITIIFLSVFFYIPFYIFINPISNILLHSEHYIYLLQLMYYTAFFQALGIIPFTLLKLQSKPLLYSLTNIIKLVVTILLTIYFVIYKKRGVEGIYEAQLIGSIFLIFFLIKYLIKNIHPIYDFSELKNLLKYSLPLLFASISGILLSIFDRFGLTFNKGLEEAAIYGLAYKISNTIKLVIITSIQMAISPLLFKKMNDPDGKDFYKKSMNIIVLTVNFFVFLVSVFSFEIILTLAHDKYYLNSIYIIPILSFSILFGAMKNMAVIGLHITKKTSIIGLLIFSIAITNLILNTIMIPIWGVYGASFSTLISQILFFLLIYYFAQKHYRINYEFLKYILYTVSTVFFVIISFFIQFSSIYLNIIAKLCLTAAYIFMVIHFFLGREEYQYLKGFYYKWKYPGNFKNNIKSL